MRSNFYRNQHENNRKTAKQTAIHASIRNINSKNSLEYIIKNPKIICKQLLVKFKRITHNPEELQKFVKQLIDDIYYKLDIGYNGNMIKKQHFQQYTYLLKQFKTKNSIINEKIQEFIYRKLVKSQFNTNQDIGMDQINIRQNSQNLCCFLHLPVMATGQNFTINSLDGYCKIYMIKQLTFDKVMQYICAMLNNKQAVLFIGIDGRVGRGSIVKLTSITKQHFQKITKLVKQKIKNRIFPQIQKTNPENVIIQYQFLKLEQNRQENQVVGVGKIYVNTWRYNQTYFIKQLQNYKLYVQPEQHVTAKQEVYEIMHKRYEFENKLNPRLSWHKTCIRQVWENILCQNKKKQKK